MSRKKITRRNILKTAGVLTATSLITACNNGGTPDKPSKSPVTLKKRYNWKMVTTWPKNFPGLGTGAQRLADSVNEMSEGRLNIKLYAKIEDLESIKFVNQWEDLPNGKWLPNDENGINWYLDDQGRHWYSDNGGFKIFQSQ